MMMQEREREKLQCNQERECWHDHFRAKVKQHAQAERTNKQKRLHPVEPKTKTQTQRVVFKRGGVTDETGQDHGLGRVNDDDDLIPGALLCNKPSI